MMALLTFKPESKFWKSWKCIGKNKLGRGRKVYNPKVVEEYEVDIF